MFSKGRTASTFVGSNWQHEEKTICLWRKLYPMGTQMLKHLSDVINLFFKCFSVDYDVINVRDKYILSKTNKTVFHKMLKELRFQIHLKDTSLLNVNFRPTRRIACACSCGDK